MEGRYSDVWAQIATHARLPNTTRAAESIDNGAAISWSFSVAPGAQSTYSHYTTFSPTGVAGPPPAAVTTPSNAVGPNGLLSTPTNLRCISKRYFPIRLRKKFWPNIAAVTIKGTRKYRTCRGRLRGGIPPL